MEIKMLLAVGATVLPAMAFSGNYFKMGTQWTVKMGSSPAEMKTIVYSVDDGTVLETDDPHALRLIRTTEEGEQTLEAIILAEGEKVFFWNYEGEWCLLYDFSLQPGDETVLFSGMYSPDSVAYPESVVAKCEKIVNACGDVPFDDGVFFLTTYLTDTEVPYTQAIWYNGVGSMQGPLVNFENDIDGLTMQLVKVTSGDDVIFDYENSLGVHSISGAQDLQSPTYRLDGTPDNGQPGVIISNGKKLVRKITNSY